MRLVNFDPITVRSIFNIVKDPIIKHTRAHILTYRLKKKVFIFLAHTDILYF